MFEKIEAKLIGAGVLLAIIAVFIGIYVYRGYKVEKLKAQIVPLQTANKVMDKTIKQDAAVSVITNTINTDLAKANVDVNTKHNDINNRVQQQVAKTETNFRNNISIPGPDTKTELDILKWKLLKQTESDTQTSTIMIKGLWEEYCIGASTDQMCKPTNGK